MIKLSEIGCYNCGLASILSKGKWGFINKKGEITINCQYEKAGAFSEGVSPVKENNKWSFIDASDNRLCEFDYEDTGHFSGGIAPVKKNKKWGAINKSGEVVVPFIYDFISNFSEQVAVAKMNGKYGYIDNCNSVKVPFEYEIAESFSSDIAYVDKGKGQHGYINHRGEFVINFDKGSYRQRSLSNEIITVFNSKNILKATWSIMNNKGEIIKDSIKCNKISMFNEGGAPIEDYNRKWGMIDINGEIKIPFEYDYISILSEGLSYAIKNKKAGYIDINNNTVIPFEYSAVTDFSDGLALVNFDKWNPLIINKEGEVAFEIQKELSLKNIIKYLAFKWESI